VLAPKEGLAVMNSTAVLTALAALAHRRASHLARVAAALAGMIMDVKGSRGEHMDSRIFELKPHAGQIRCAAWIRGHLEHEDREEPPQRRIQDRYSLRCAAHVIGALMDTLPWARRIIETEMGSVNDNPLVLHRQRIVLHGCNFYGGHVGLVMDTLKIAVASVADLLDRQLMLLLNAGEEYGLPINLNGASGDEQPVNHGFKAMQISASALTAEALRNTMPATSFSRSTESHNQDKVSMGTIAARDALRVLDLTEKVTAIGLLCAAQAVDLRGVHLCSPASRALHAHVRREIPMVAQDRRMDRDIMRGVAWIRARELPVTKDA
jgi:histidine ammonia-lyase